MAKKEQELTASMIDTFREFKETKNIDRTTLVSVLEESFRNVLAKIFGSDENFDVIVNPDKGDFEIYRNRIVVADGEVEDENKEITLSEARKIEPDYEVGEDVSETVDFNKFGRRAILWIIVLVVYTKDDRTNSLTLAVSITRNLLSLRQHELVVLIIYNQNLALPNLINLTRDNLTYAILVFVVE